MRIRFKAWARPELEASSFYIDNPEEYKGKWKNLYSKDNPIHLRAGLWEGKFYFTISCTKRKHKLYSD